MNAAPSKTAPLLFRIADAIAKLRRSFMIQVPEGYQDESGFYYGRKPAAKQITWPPTD